MQIINIKKKGVFKLACDVLKHGGIVMHPTETCYGLAVDVSNEEALRKLYRVKGMSLDKPVSILVNSFEMAQKYGVFSEKAKEIARKYWPGPLSIVVRRSGNLPVFLNKDEKYVSIRFSDNKFCVGVVDAFGGPVTTTSANRSGGLPFYKVDLDSDGDFLKGMDLIVDGGELVENKPSTIVKVDGNEVEVLRQGEVVLK